MKLIVVSNRLPITVSSDENGFKYKKTSGGLVTGIESLSNHIDFVWMGNVSGIELTEENKSKITKDCWDKFTSVPVFLSPELNDLSYNGFCNGILWPAIHSFPDNVKFGEAEYEGYKEYNRIFANRILDMAEDNDIIWVHDYHLMLVPEMLRKENKTLKIMFFLHTAFAEVSNLKSLICIEDLLRGISASDVISFHLPEYSLNFRDAVRNLGIETKAAIKALPIGIDPEMFRKCLDESETKDKIKEFKTKFAGKKIILGVDRTDYIKGLPHKMKGFQSFLKRNPGKEKEVVLLQIAIPSRPDVMEYSAYVSQVNEIVTETNGSYGDITTTPIHFLFGSVPFTELCALYAVADCVLITSIIDGMNLVALEYVSCQDKNKGVVILSKFAGALTTLQGSVSHNPCNTEEIAEAIEQALSLSEDEREVRHKMNKRNIDLFTSVKWAEDNLGYVYSDWRSEISRK